MKIFILDDCKLRHHKFTEGLIGAEITRAYTADQAYRALRHTRYDVIFLDHDLEMSGERCGSGSEVVAAIALLLEIYPSTSAIHCVHSMNPVAAIHMVDVLRKQRLNVKRCEEAWEETAAMETLVATSTWTFPERGLNPLAWDMDS